MSTKQKSGGFLHPSVASSIVRLRRSRRKRGDDAATATDATSTKGSDAYMTGSSSYASSRRAKQYENTYKMAPDVQFDTAVVERTLEEVLVERLKEVTYEPTECRAISQELAGAIMERIKQLQYARYKLVSVVSIGSINERPGMQFGSRCLWNKETDTFASVKYTNGSLFALAVVYGLYYE